MSTALASPTPPPTQWLWMRPITKHGTVRIASEPFDDDPAWLEVPEDTVVVAALGDLRTLPL